MTEEEALRVEEKRFLYLNDKFKEIWMYEDDIRVIGSSNGELRFLFPPMLCWEVRGSSGSSSDNYRALNDRLEKALKGEA